MIMPIYDEPEIADRFTDGHLAAAAKIDCQMSSKNTRSTFILQFGGMRLGDSDLVTTSNLSSVHRHFSVYRLPDLMLGMVVLEQGTDKLSERKQGVESEKKVEKGGK
ncbi:Os07g0185366 [Oryza sativa Japonica Group]|uniref:Os07g0185366 protein n=1 Tax=Oryza sativa subsp. japonica TaxID=39947 RepID=A0A0P0X3B2_ORYSJ|nr:Os07g0185366 [Oryza sativa Japonica Group]